MIGKFTMLQKSCNEHKIASFNVLNANCCNMQEACYFQVSITITKNKQELRNTAQITS